MTYVYRADGSIQQHGLDETLSGEEVLPGFTFDLSVFEGPGFGLMDVRCGSRRT